MKPIVKRILLAFVLALFFLAIIFHKSLYYGLVQARGQLAIIFNTVPVSEVLSDPKVPDSIRVRIKVVGEVRAFAEKTLGLNAGKNYTTYYDQKTGNLMWVLTACEPFALKAYEWQFPVIGKFSYKGFFDKKMAVAEEIKLKERGYDTSIRTADGWSTLGILKDPILSGMLDQDEAEIADLIIHELTHATIFIHDSVEFNENLASFIGDYGTLEFLKHKYGTESVQYRNYDSLLMDRGRYNRYILRCCSLLDSLYHSFGSGLTIREKNFRKEELIRGIVDHMDTLHFSTGYYRGGFFSHELPNNTYFMSFLRYRALQYIFITRLNNQFDGNLPAYIEFLKKEYK